MFAEDEGHAVEMLRATGGDIAAYPLFDMPSVPAWHRGSLVLAGDAPDRPPLPRRAPL